MRVTHPDHALVFGAARTILLENPKHLVMCLDVESNTTTSWEAIHTGLKHIQSVQDLKHVDAEFVERAGIYHTSRIVPADAMNQAEREDKEGMQLSSEVIGNHRSTIRLVCEQPGTLDALVYKQFAEEPPLGEDEVEVEVRAAALNFKVCPLTKAKPQPLTLMQDLANAMGFVAANEHFFGLEGAGVVTRIGKDVTTIQVSDRVMMVSQGDGCFANRMRTRFHGIQRLPDWMSFEVRRKSTIPPRLDENQNFNSRTGRCNTRHLLLHRHPLLSGSCESTERTGTWKPGSMEIR